MLEGEDWKRVRSIVTPTFSTGKIKRVSIQSFEIYTIFGLHILRYVLEIHKK